ncbi:uncharacterized protein CEXT_800861 [Caerostris extrusa]|uniref:Uncharacterized protein n=1 Tax=Caerostris extrusa TaxID=172846 RepID=A0AAV4PAJ9_CAEEX|nr:uncharacterized protein CEXT_800861 [Caerostris extrusa]
MTFFRQKTSPSATLQKPLHGLFKILERKWWNWACHGKAIPNFAKDNRADCAQSCSSPCRMGRYEVQVQEANSEGSRRSCAKAAESDLSCATLVHIIFENLEITTFTYTPRYEPIGMLSFIGGFLGLWLGISLLTVYDFLESRLFQSSLCN